MEILSLLPWPAHCRYKSSVAGTSQCVAMAAPEVVVAALCTPGKVGLDLQPAEDFNLGRGAVMICFSFSEEM